LQSGPAADSGAGDRARVDAYIEEVSVRRENESPEQIMEVGAYKSRTEFERWERFAKGQKTADQRFTRILSEKQLK